MFECQMCREIRGHVIRISTWIRKQVTYVILETKKKHFKMLQTI